MNKATKILIGAGLLVLFLLAGIGIGTLLSGGGNQKNNTDNTTKTVNNDSSKENDKVTAVADNSSKADTVKKASSDDSDVIDAGGLPVGGDIDKADGSGSYDVTNDSSQNSANDKNAGQAVTDKESEVNNGSGAGDADKNTEDKGSNKNSEDKAGNKGNNDKTGTDNGINDKNSSDKGGNGDSVTDGDTNKNEVLNVDTDDKEGNDRNVTDIDDVGKNITDKDSNEKDSIKDDKSKKESYTLTVSTDNSWSSGNVTMYGLQFGITNGSATTISGWNLEVEIEGLSGDIDGWNGTFTASGNTLKVKNANYNGDIYSNGQIVIGCNLGTTAGKLNIKSAKLNGKAMEVVGGKVDQNQQNNNPGGNSGNNGGSSGGNSGSGGNDKINDNVDVSDLLKRSDKAKQGDDWLHTDGKNILDKNGKKVWLTGLNWFGYNTGTNTFDGLWNSKLVPTVKAIADHGFNLIRVPMSAELINQWSRGEYPKANYNNAYNTELNDMNSLEIWEYFLALAEANGIKVMPDIHSAETNASGHNVNLWYTDKVTVNDYYHALEWMAERYKNNDTIIAYDLKNEPHGKPYEGSSAAIWNDSKSANNWKYVAETAAAKILAKNPNVLIMIEGIEIYPIDLKSNSDYHSTNDKDYYFNWWGGNLRAVEDYPINLGKYQDKLVYSPHDYGPTVYNQPWFDKDYDFDSLMEDCWHDNWFYIYEENIAPLLIGEWGGYMTKPNITWMTYMRKLIKDNHLNHTFWCLNANSGDTGGLLLDDFTTWDTEKYNFVKEVLWQENGKFVGLDHQIPLGDNGITCSEAKGLK